MPQRQKQCYRLRMTGLETVGAVASIVIAAATTATLGVLIWYTIETYKLRREAQRQNENVMKPIVALQSVSVRGQYAGTPRPIIRNLGSGPAFNVCMEALRIAGRTATFEHPRTLAPGQDEFVIISGLRETTKQGPTGNFEDGKIRHTYELLKDLKATPDIMQTNGTITYQSASGKKYRTTFTMDHKSDDTESFIVFGGVEAL